MPKESDTRVLDTPWQVLFYLVKNDLPVITNAEIARAIGISRSAVSRAVDALVAGRVLERTASGGLELSLFFAEAYARRLRYWQRQHGRMRLAIQAMGAEIALLAGEDGTVDSAQRTQRGKGD